jgi:hypothetical protein
MSNFLNFAGNSGVTFKNHGTGGGTSFTLDKSASTNSVLLSIGGIIQKPVTDYSISGTAITTTSSVTSGVEVFSFIIHDAGNAPVIEDNSVTGAKIALGSDAQGDVMYYNGSDWARLAAGTNGHFLKTQGSGANPAWAEAGGGAMNYISSVTISSGVAEFTGLTTYDTYFIRYERMIGSASANDRIVLSDDNASSYESSGYAFTGIHYATNGSSVASSRSTSYIDLSYTYAGSSYMSGQLWLQRKASSATGAMVHARNWQLEDASGYEAGRVVTGRLDTGTIVNAIKFYRSSGNYTSGTLHLYGISQS